jgi:hypothetical protein
MLDVLDLLADRQSRRLSICVLSVGSNLIKRGHGVGESISPLKTEATAEHEDISYSIIILLMDSKSSFCAKQRQCGIDSPFGAIRTNFFQGWLMRILVFPQRYQFQGATSALFSAIQTSRNSRGYRSQQELEYEWISTP